METLKIFIEQSVEFKEWGMNPIIVSGFMILILGAFQSITGIMQVRKIWMHRKAEKVSLPLCAYMACYSLSLIVYGYDDSRGKRSLAFMSMGMIGVIFLIVAILILIYQKPIARWEKGIAGICVLFVPGMYFIADRNIMLTIEVCTGGIFLSHQLYETYTGYRKKKLGELEPAVVWVFLISCGAWFVFALYTGNIVFAISNPIAGTLLALTLWFYYATKRRVYRKDQYEFARPFSPTI